MKLAVAAVASFLVSTWVGATESVCFRMEQSPKNTKPRLTKICIAGGDQEAIYRTQFFHLADDDAEKLWADVPVMIKSYEEQGERGSIPHWMTYSMELAAEDSDEGMPLPEAIDGFRLQMDLSYVNKELSPQFLRYGRWGMLTLGDEDGQNRVLNFVNDNAEPIVRPNNWARTLLRGIKGSFFASENLVDWLRDKDPTDRYHWRQTLPSLPIDEQVSRVASLVPGFGPEAGSAFVGRVEEFLNELESLEVACLGETVTIGSARAVRLYTTKVSARAGVGEAIVREVKRRQPAAGCQVEAVSLGDAKTDLRLTVKG